MMGYAQGTYRRTPYGGQARWRYRSYRTQQMLNYFDETDQRVRENPVTIDAQLLNIAGLQLDALSLKLMRERDARFLSGALAHLDNHGVWYALNIPNSFTLPPEGQSLGIQGRIGTTWTGLNPYEVDSPFPAHVALDTTRSPVALKDPVLFTLTGGQVLQKVAPGVLSFPNRLTFWLEGLNVSGALVDVHIEGERHPRPAWTNEQSRSDETLISRTDGQFVTKHVWAKIDRITVRGLPTGATLRCWLLPCNMPAVADPRPYSDPAVRDVQFPRFWQLGSDYLTEVYNSGNYGGMVEIQSYKLARPVSCMAVEPYTSLMYLADGRTLYVADRRELFPDNREHTGQIVEPAFTFFVRANPDKTTASIKYVTLSPLRNRGIAMQVRYRWVVEAPDSSLTSLKPDGTPVAYTPRGGWQLGMPPVIEFPMTQTGTYTFTLETQGDREVVTQECVPVNNQEVQGVEFDLSSEIGNIQGLAFDYAGRLWAWTGDYAVPLETRYHAYMLDRDAGVIYLTDTYDEVQLS